MDSGLTRLGFTPGGGAPAGRASAAGEMESMSDGEAMLFTKKEVRDTFIQGSAFVVKVKK